MSKGEVWLFTVQVAITLQEFLPRLPDALAAVESYQKQNLFETQTHCIGGREKKEKTLDGKFQSSFVLIQLRQWAGIVGGWQHAHRNLSTKSPRPSDITGDLQTFYIPNGSYQTS